MTKEIPLTQGLVALVDDDDFDEINRFKWFAKKDGRNIYAARTISLGKGRKSTVRMHRQLLQASAGDQVDHISGDGLDNRRENIRIVTSQQNAMNRRHRSDSRHRFKGVRLMHSRYWYAVIKVGGRYQCHRASCEVDAARLYDDLARQHFGEFASLNFPDEREEAA